MLQRFFRLTERNTTVKTEAVAGFTTFLTMLYIVPTNAMIMSQAGMPMEALVTATALITLIACIANGLWSNTPICMSVGMGLNAYFTFGLVMGLGLAWQTALGVVFLSSFLFLALSLTPLRRWVFESLPDEIKCAISAGIGAFIAFIGLKQMGIIADSPATLVTLGNLHSPEVLLGLFGLLMVFVLSVKRVKGALMLSILATSLLGWAFAIAPLPERLLSAPASIAPIAFALDIEGALTLALLPVIITFMITHMFDSLGTIAGVGSRAKLFQGKQNQELERTLQVDAGASTLGSLLGLSTTTCFVESASGVEEGGRTGLTAVVCGLCFILTLFMLPLFQSIPPNAIYPVLVMIGVFMFGELRHIQFTDLQTSIPVFLTVMMMLLTFSISHGIAWGFLAYVVVNAASGRREKLNAATLLVAALAVIPLVMK